LNSLRAVVAASPVINTSEASLLLCLSLVSTVNNSKHCNKLSTDYLLTIYASTSFTFIVLIGSTMTESNCNSYLNRDTDATTKTLGNQGWNMTD